MTQARAAIEPVTKPALYTNILVALDSSDQAKRGIAEAATIASLSNAKVTGTHVYAAKLHDQRFRQMEGGLPEQFREEQELERQRDVHDDLITRGLSIITDSYLDQAERACTDAGVRFARRSLEGKNYRELVKEADSGEYDLLVMGARGLGAVGASSLGTVCERVTRRTCIDTLVIKDPQRSLAKGPIVVAVDGSPHAYGGLQTALSLAERWNVPVQVVAAFDPYYHYVAFNNIAAVLSEEAGRVFRFREQEKLHEEIIDSGLAKIYAGHLSVAEKIAQARCMSIETLLLDGKPHVAIEKQLKKVTPSLLVIGKLGIHADPELDIGGNAENLLRNVECAVLLSQQRHQPQVDLIADVTTSWTQEAEKHMEKVPDFVRSMVRMAILRYAQERGHTVITEKIVEEATAQLMPGHAEQAMTQIVAAHEAGELKPPPAGDLMRWSEQARSLLLTVEDLSLRGNLSMRAEKKARQDGSEVVEKRHITTFLEAPEANVSETVVSEDLPGSSRQRSPTGEARSAQKLNWQAAALARLMRVPQGFMRDASRERIEDYAREQGISEISLEVAEQGLAVARQAMERAMQPGGGTDALATGAEVSVDRTQGLTPNSQTGVPQGVTSAMESQTAWSVDAEERLLSVPTGFCRDMTRKAAETIAARKGLAEIDPLFLEQIMKTFEAGAKGAVETLPWDEEARARIQRAPEMVQGMLVKEIEGWARRNGLGRVDQSAVDAVKRQWQESGLFHLDPTDPRNPGQG